ncbi:MAG: site-specific DNA-methyltransferase [Zoogloea oleivorans]|jgi:adenine-specific DNA-methyltransferase|uniref:site-specific DNA-methyltransferase n=1 Tax=Zoogloea oleivorans TaxID=1552750 RepID=UPI002A36C305|nr:site-specific DNA-methyltransferase [Zoogloea oleivorans]MDY0038471.1 site-specific DNA-methyltransferase [Zoogloea oleivorans]
MTTKTKLELTWPGKQNRPRLEPRILLEDKALSYHAAPRTAPDLVEQAADAAPTAFDDNLLIQGDNLLALKALEGKYAGKVKCVFIDPPYNTGSAFTHYDDGVEHSMWLTLIRDRLEIIRTLLAEDGSLWITIDDNEAHYLKVVCDEVFGRANFVANMIWEKRTSRENRRVFSFNHDHLLVYAKIKGEFEKVRNPLELNDEVLARYKNPDNDPRGLWQSVSANAQAGHATASQFYSLTLPSGRELEPPKGRCWLYTKERMQQEMAAGNIWFGANGDNAPRLKKFLRDNEDKGLTPETIWSADDVGTNDDAKKGLLQLLPSVPVFDNPKPEGLIERVVHIATNPGDLVLDSFAGSGTTGAVAHKMGRRWIMVELGEHCHTHIVPRLKKVIDGQDPGGITKAVGWQGGGGFRYYRLAPSLLKKDKWGHWVINPEYNGEMLSEAMCKLMGFSYAPSQSTFWQHGRSTETDFIYVTTGSLSHDQLRVISEEVGNERTLLICCKAFMADVTAFPNLTLKKIPKTVLHKCEWDHDDYSFSIDVLAEPEVMPDEDDEFALNAGIEDADDE